jgi:multifunctional 2-oxoglutarate metabolism enzyme
VVAGGDKWKQSNSLTLLLPHGFEGQGPEHSSARLERFLTLAAEGSIQIAQPSTAAQYFHLLRRQAHPSIQKPLIVMTPKSLLRHPAARSATNELTGGRWRETIDDAAVEDPAAVRRILLCSGKVAYHLMEAGKQRTVPVAIVRVEQLYPFPEKQLLDIFDRYGNANELLWVQDEPENMGAWRFVFHQLWGKAREGLAINFVARHESASPATGSVSVHEQEQEDLIERAFAAL